MGIPTVSSLGEFFVLAVAGDSNKDGRGDPGDRPTVPANTLFHWNGSGLDEITTQTVSNDGDYGSFVQAFAIKLKAETGMRTLVINGAAGGAYISSQPSSSPPNNDWSATGILYDPFVTAVNDACSYIERVKPDLIVFGDGINDIRSAVADATIASALDNLLGRLHVSFPNVPVILTQVGLDGTSSVTTKLYNLRTKCIDVAFIDSLVHIVSHAASFRSPNWYQVDLLHYTQDAYDAQGQMIARWVTLSSYSKWARAVLSSMFTDLSTNRKDLIAAIIDGLVARTEYRDLEYLGLFFMDDVKNTYFDLSLMTFGFPVNNTFSANSHIATDGVAQRFVPGVIPNLCTRTSQNNFLEGIYIITNNVPGGTGGTPFGATNTTHGHAVIQGGATEIYLANDSTNTTSGGSPPLNAPMYHGVRRSGTTKAKIENKTEVHSTTQASTGRSVHICSIGCNGGGSFTSFFNGTYGWYVYAEYDSFDFDSLYDDVEFARAHWND